MEHAKFAFAEVPVFILLKLTDHVIQLCVVPKPPDNLFAQSVHAGVKLIQFPGEDLLLHLVHIVLQFLEMMEILCDQPLQELTKEAPHAQLPLGIPLLQVLDSGAGRSSIVAQHGPFLG